MTIRTNKDDPATPAVPRHDRLSWALLVAMRPARMPP